jgi:hypothetical protein
MRIIFPQVYVTSGGITVKVLEHKFKKSNINTYGTKCLGSLFSNKELKQGYIEPSREQVDSDRFQILDQERINLIKGI